MRPHHLLAALMVILAGLVPMPVAAANDGQVVATGLDSPRGIAWLDGHLFVAEAGHGGPTCIHGLCIGFTSQISEILDNGTPDPAVTDLLSLSMGEEGTVGADGLTVWDGRLVTIIGENPQELQKLGALCTTDACREVIDDAVKQAGHLLKVRPWKDRWRSIASVGEFDYEFTKTIKPPQVQEIDANPYGLLALDDEILVVDSGSNTLDSVDEDGNITVRHYFPWRNPGPGFPSDSVPTCAAGDGGRTWVGDLSGRLYRLEGKSSTEVVPTDRSGRHLLAHVTGCVLDGNNLYLVNMWDQPNVPPGPTSTGSIIRYDTATGEASVLADHLFMPNMATIGPHHKLYVTAGSICPKSAPGGPCQHGGTVLKFRIPPASDDD